VTDDPRDDARPAIVTDRPLLFDDEATLSPTLPNPEPGRADPPDRSGRRNERARRRRRNWAVVGVLALLILPFVLAAGWFVWELNPPGDTGTPVAVVVEPGWGTKEAGDALQQAGVIGSSLAFQLWSKVSGGGTFQAGTYQLTTHMGVRDARDALERGPDAAVANDFTLLLPPGLTLQQIADRVGKLPGHDSATFLQLARSGAVRSKYQPADQPSVEGLTWPDTYFVGKDQSDTDILRTIVTAFDKHADAANLASAPATTGGTLTPYQAVVSASLIQAEAGAGDAANVSAVIVNRLRQGIPLQIDATLCYAKGGCPPVPNNADKASTSPYNTYKVVGLPPTPIMTVTDAALTAALHPANVPYLFYVTGKDGVTRFSTTLAEHEQNIAKYGVRGE
jgi:UPF0755 protein